MDSLTQAALGAAIGEAVLGKKIGNKAAVLGAIIGTIPDLDVMLVPFFDEFQKISLPQSHNIEDQNRTIFFFYIHEILAFFLKRIGYLHIQIFAQK